MVVYNKNDQLTLSPSPQQSLNVRKRRRALSAVARSKHTLRYAQASRSKSLAIYLAEKSRVAGLEQKLALGRMRAFEAQEEISSAHGFVERRRARLRSALVKFNKEFIDTDNEDEDELTSYLGDAQSSDFDICQDFKVLPPDHTDDIMYCPFPMSHRNHFYDFVSKSDTFDQPRTFVASTPSRDSNLNDTAVEFEYAALGADVGEQYSDYDDTAEISQHSFDAGEDHSDVEAELEEPGGDVAENAIGNIDEETSEIEDAGKPMRVI